MMESVKGGAIAVGSLIVIVKLAPGILGETREQDELNRKVVLGFCTWFGQYGGQRPMPTAVL